MMRCSFMLVVLAVMASHAIAADGAAAKVDPALCRMLVKHTPDANVAYQPDVDVHGHAVTPADVAGTPQINLPKQIKIPLTVNLAKTLNLNTSTYPANQLGTGTEANLGTFIVEGDTVSFNGQPLTDDQQDNLAVLCLQPK